MIVIALKGNVVHVLSIHAGEGYINLKCCVQLQITLAFSLTQLVLRMKPDDDNRILRDIQDCLGIGTSSKKYVLKESLACQGLC